MAIIARYMYEGDSHTYPTIAQAQLAEFLKDCETIYLEQHRIASIAEHLDKYFVITPRPVVEVKESKDETL